MCKAFRKSSLDWATRGLQVQLIIKVTLPSSLQFGLTAGASHLGMALSGALAALSLLPLLDAQSPACASLTAAPITNATLDQVRPSLGP